MFQRMEILKRFISNSKVEDGVLELTVSIKLLMIAYQEQKLAKEAQLHMHPAINSMTVFFLLTVKTTSKIGQEFC